MDIVAGQMTFAFSDVCLACMVNWSLKRPRCPPLSRISNFYWESAAGPSRLGVSIWWHFLISSHVCCTEPQSYSDITPFSGARVFPNRNMAFLPPKSEKTGTFKAHFTWTGRESAPCLVKHKPQYTCLDAAGWWNNAGFFFLFLHYNAEGLHSGQRRPRRREPAARGLELRRAQRVRGRGGGKKPDGRSLVIDTI